MRWVSFFASGIPVILVFPAPSLSYLAWFALVPAMVLFTRAGTTREAVARGWWFGAGYLIAMLYWMAAEIGPGLVLLGAVMGWMWSPFAVAVCKLLKPGAPGWRLAAAFIVVPSCWLIPEWIRSYQGLGGPWDLYGASQWQHPAVLALAAVGGVWLVSVALLMANVALTALLGALRLRADGQSRHRVGPQAQRFLPGGRPPVPRWPARPMAKSATVSGAQARLSPGGTTPRSPRCEAPGASRRAVSNHHPERSVESFDGR